MGLNSSFLEKLQQNLLPVANAIGGQKHVTAMRNGLMQTVPLTVIGGIFLLLASPPTNSAVSNAFLRAWADFASANSGWLLIPFRFSLSLISLYSIIFIAKDLAESYDMNPMGSMMSSLFAFLAVCAPAVAANPESKALYIPMQFLDGKGLFTAIIIAFLSVEINRFLYNKNIKIKMPDSVPPMVSAPFEALVPFAINTLLFLFISQAAVSYTGVSIPELILNLFAPLVSATDSIGGILIAITIINLLWFCGIHGGNVVNSVLTPILLMNLNENAAAIAAGGVPERIMVNNYFTTYANIGGSGACLGLAIAMILAAKSNQLKVLSRAGIIPDLFNISEPFVFGTPLIMNVTMFIPMMLAPIVNAVISYTAFSTGIVSKGYLNIPWTMPSFIGGALATMDIKAGIMIILLIVIDVLIYLPFVKIYDRQLVKNEQASEADQA